MISIDMYIKSRNFAEIKLRGSMNLNIFLKNVLQCFLCVQTLKINATLQRNVIKECLYVDTSLFQTPIKSLIITLER